MLCELKTYKMKTENMQKASETSMCLIYAGSAVSGEGLVNVYRGTGRVLMCPVAPTTSLFESTNTLAAKAAAKSSNTFGK